MIKLSKIVITNYCLLLLLGVVCMTACTEKEMVPLIEEKIMVRLLADLHISEAATQNADVTLRDSFRQLYYEQIFKIHEIDQALFEKELTQLKKNPKKLSAYYDQVLKVLQDDKEPQKKGPPMKKSS